MSNLFFRHRRLFATYITIKTGIKKDILTLQGKTLKNSIGIIAIYKV
jgi:hypothetical protein